MKIDEAAIFYAQGTKRWDLFKHRVAIRGDNGFVETYLGYGCEPEELRVHEVMQFHFLRKDGGLEIFNG